MRAQPGDGKSSRKVCEPACRGQIESFAERYREACIEYIARRGSVHGLYLRRRNQHGAPIAHDHAALASELHDRDPSAHVYQRAANHRGLRRFEISRRQAHKDSRLRFIGRNNIHRLDQLEGEAPWQAPGRE